MQLKSGLQTASHAGKAAARPATPNLSTERWGVMGAVHLMGWAAPGEWHCRTRVSNPLNTAPNSKLYGMLRTCCIGEGGAGKRQVAGFVLWGAERVQPAVLHRPLPHAHCVAMKLMCESFDTGEVCNVQRN